MEKQIIAYAKAGDKAAFNDLVSLYQGKLQSVIKRYVHEPAEVADVCQDVLLKIYRALPTFRQESCFYTWIYRIAINTAKTYLMHQKRLPAHHVSIDAIEADTVADTAFKEIASPEGELIGEQVKVQLLKAVDALPYRLRQALILRELDGLSYEHIADRLHCPVGTVRSRLFRARAAIGNQLHPLLYD